MTGEGPEDMTTNTMTELLEKQHKEDAWVSFVLQAVLVLWHEAFYLSVFSHVYCLQLQCVVLQELLMEKCKTYWWKLSFVAGCYHVFCKRCVLAP